MLTRSGKERERSQQSTEDEEPKENPLHQDNSDNTKSSSSTPSSQKKTTPCRPVTRKLTDFWLIGHPSTSVNGAKLPDCRQIMKYVLF